MHLQTLHNSWDDRVFQQGLVRTLFGLVQTSSNRLGGMLSRPIQDISLGIQMLAGRERMAPGALSADAGSRSA